MIDIKNIVDVDFKIIKSETSLGSYNTVVYFVKDDLYKANGGVAEKTADAIICTNLKEVNTALNSDAKTLTSVSAENFFENGGVKLVLVKPSGYTLETFTADIDKVRTTIRKNNKANNSEDNFIYVAISNVICGYTSEEETLEDKYTKKVLLQIAKYFEELATPNTLRLLLTYDNNDTFSNNFSGYSVAIKYCTKKINATTIDAALLIGAYFTKINLNESEAIKDYCYTAETLVDLAVGEDASENVTQAEYELLIKRNYNFIDTIGNNVINFGGNLTNGTAITTDFATICVENDVCGATLSAMIGKQYLSQSGLTNLVSCIESQLQRYKSNGFIKIDSTYSGENLYINYNNRSYAVISKGEALPQGFKVFAVPVANISLVDKETKKFTPIYVVIESLSGARIVEIRGEVR